MEDQLKETGLLILIFTLSILFWLFSFHFINGDLPKINHEVTGSIS